MAATILIAWSAETHRLEVGSKMMPTASAPACAAVAASWLRQTPQILTRVRDMRACYHICKARVVHVRRSFPCVRPRSRERAGHAGYARWRKINARREASFCDSQWTDAG